jgi:hypothetical protein
VDATALDCRPGAHLADSAAQARIAVDGRQHRRRQPTRDEVVETAFLCAERLTAAQLQGEQALMATAEGTNDAENEHADDSSGTADAALNASRPVSPARRPVPWKSGSIRPRVPVLLSRRHR